MPSRGLGSVRTINGCLPARVARAFQTPITIQKALGAIERREYVLPAIQREFVWWPEQIECLFDSLMQGYPIGSFPHQLTMVARMARLTTGFAATLDAPSPQTGRWCADAGRPTRFKPSSPSPTDAVRDGSAKLGHPVQNVTREHGLTPLPR